MGTVQKAKKIPKDVFEKMWSNLTGREKYDEDII